VLTYVREWTPPGADEPERVLVIANLSRYAQACELDLARFAGTHPVEMLGRSTFPQVGDQPYVLTLGPYQYLWFSLQRDPSRVTLSKLPEFATDMTDEHDAPLPTVTVSGDWTALLRGPGRRRLEAALPDLLRRQRWFGGKARTIRGVSLADVIPIGARDRAQLQVLIAHVEFVDGEPDDYVIPVTFAEGEEAGRLQAVSPRSVLATVKGQGAKASSGVLVDALTEPEAAKALMTTIAKQRRHKGSAGDLVGTRLAGFDRVRDAAEMDVHPLRGEQSNSSVIFGDRMLMKVLRRLEPGVSPDVEIGAFLNEFEHVPEVLGTLDVLPGGDGPPRTLAMIQRFVPNEGDAWSQTLDELGRFAERVVSDPTGSQRPTPVAKGDALSRALTGIPETVHEATGPYLDAMRLLGRRTGEMHIALADAKGDVAFAPERMTQLYQRGLYQSVRNAVRIGLRAAKREVASVPDETLRAEVETLVDREEEILDRLRSISAQPIEADRIRTHGDYHLGQVLFTGRDFVIIDFEGEPARPLGERRLKRSPMRDLAGMLRSLQYATASTLHDQIERGLVTPDQPNHAALEAWLDWWLAWTSAALLEGYLDVAADQSFVPDDPEHTRILLDAFTLEKAVYELGYEMNNRPSWVCIPLAGITQVLDRHER
jgi:maltose alpha-D-glucosyltransferase/alpha-amylase